jgi:hypothetical protein
MIFLKMLFLRYFISKDYHSVCIVNDDASKEKYCRNTEKKMLKNIEEK